MRHIRIMLLSITLGAGALLAPASADAAQSGAEAPGAAPSATSDFSSMTPEEIYAAKTRVTHEELMKQLGVSESTTAAPTTLASVCAFAADGDDVHTSTYSGVLYASGHGYWWNYTCPSDWRANVTIFLEENLGGSWYPQGDSATGYNRLPGSGSTQRVTAKMRCINTTSHQWRSIIVVDIVGHADTAPAATTPTRTLSCY